MGNNYLNIIMKRIQNKNKILNNLLIEEWKKFKI